MIEDINEFDEFEVNNGFSSECCGAPIYGEICGYYPNEVGICSRCKEWSGVHQEPEEE